MNDRDAWTQHVTRGDVARAKAALAAKPSKYRNQKTTVDGITFDSAKEAKRYQVLTLLARGGQIEQLHCQMPFALVVEGTRLGDYVADFTYVERGVCIVEDVKGVRTALYRWKKKHFEAQYRVAIRET